MFAKGIEELTQRKRHIIVETGLYRNLVELEFASVRSRIDSALAGVRSRSPWLKAGGMVAGLLVARRWSGLGSWIPTALAAWRWIQSLK